MTGVVVVSTVVMRSVIVGSGVAFVSMQSCTILDPTLPLQLSSHVPTLPLIYLSYPLIAIHALLRNLQVLVSPRCCKLLLLRPNDIDRIIYTLYAIELVSDILQCNPVSPFATNRGG